MPTNSEIRVGLLLESVGDAIAPRREIWQMADQAGFDHLWHDDHLLTLTQDRSPDGSVYESWTLLGAMAEATKRVKVGVMVTSLQYRNPGILAKMAATVDHVSGGRLEMGMGTGWSKLELSSLGMPFVGLPDRIDMFDEACTVLKLLWTQARSDFDGKFYRLVDAISEPKPLQKPHPRLWVGGEATRTLLVAARHADVWNTPMGDVEADLESNRILTEHCRAIGRDPAEIQRSTLLRMTTVDEVCQLAEGHAAAGFSELILEVYSDDPRRQVEEVAIPAMARIRDLAVAPVG